MSVWAEGIGGDVRLEIESSAAVNCSSGGAAGRAASPAVGGSYANGGKKMGDDICSGGVQTGLRYNMSAVGVYAVGDLPFPTASGETLADAICCACCPNSPLTCRSRAILTSRDHHAHHRRLGVRAVCGAHRALCPR